MSIQYEFTGRDTIRIACDFDVIEVPLPTSVSSGDAASGNVDVDGTTMGSSSSKSEGARGGVIASGPQPSSGRPKQVTRAMGLITRTGVTFDWTQMDLSESMLSLDGNANMSKDELARHLSQRVFETFTGNAGDKLKFVDVGVKPWSGTTPEQLENLRSIVEDPSIPVDAVRLFRLPDSN
ncbi:hypothetical protein [Paraburkholderia caballeronis]|uniref:Uncharacterized protein n=1 Tax=Paraburkholderia caballeronis TaxID=416943 RepID=A0A1H7GW28_9BURK|nr:hypothetical protein [Paraburkholderia caballeronis]PXW29747.1 hypothetical protein C7403_101605 [Paraburkholderia caballeronis]PXX05006.1 hypothetical protein C7407_101605 [Paraburkholderia caballeronis]RAK06067.1 hypothetical protein C7409_101605 [Paraburkholderia caballeronis]SEB47912.1 hypothetical protein SAMN05445871_0282 [Paraburkholderia caballeronis]SEK42244.1 hypothetical protein SAMN05192542_10231 [Paraburkholderia caballeronis]